MKKDQLLKGSVIRTIFVSIELAALIVISIITFSNDGASPWGYWGNAAIVFATLSPIIIYVIAGTIFNVFNMNIVIRKRHTVESVKNIIK